MLWSLFIELLSATNLKVCFLYSSGPDDFGWTFQHNVARLHIEKALTNAQHMVTSTAVDNVPEFGSNECTFCHEISGWNTTLHNWDTGPSPPPGLTLSHTAAVIIEDFIVNQSCGAIVGTSFFFAGDVGAMAKRHPHIPMIQAGGLPMEGIKNVMVKVYQARYLSGIAIGRYLQANPNLPKKVGYISAFPLGETIRQINAVKLGLEKVDTNIKMYLTFQFSWHNARKENIVTQRLIQFYGVEAMFQHTDSPTPALIAHQNGKVSTGSNSDMLYFVGDSVLTSPILVWGPMYEKALREYLDTGHMVADTWWLGAEDGLQTWRMGDFSGRVSLDVKTELSAEAKIISDLSTLQLQNPNDDIFCKSSGQFMLNNGSAVSDNFLETRNGLQCIKEAEVEFMNFFLDGIINDCTDSSLLVNGLCYVGFLNLPDVCPLGTRLDITGCVSCGAGYYSGNEECFKCPVGTYRGVGEQVTSSCTPCPPGKFSNSPGSSECTLCPPGTFADSPQMSRCGMCNFTLGEISFYQNDPGQVACKPCPAKAICRKELSGEYAGLIVTFQADAGFYKFVPLDSTTGNPILMECRPPEACLGYDMDTNKQICSPGMDPTAPLCGLCQVQYSRQMDNMLCKECPPWGVALFVAIIAFGGYTTLLIVLNNSSDLRGRTSQRVALRMFGNFCALVSVSLNATEGQNIFPEWFVGIWASFASVAVDALRRVTSVSCLIQTSQNFKEIAVISSHVALVGVLVLPICVFVVYTCVQFLLFREKVANLNRFIGLWSIVTFVQFPFAASLFFSPMSCVNIDVPRMRMNYAITCDEAKHQDGYTVAILGAYCYCFGAPLLIFGSMLMHRRKAGSDMFTQRYGFFTAGYRKAYFWWEPFHMLRKVFFLWTALASQHYMTKLLSLLGLTLFFFLLHAFFRPYDARHYRALDQMEFSGLCFVVVHLVSAALHYSTADYLSASAWPRNLRDAVLGVCWMGTLSLALSSYASVLFGWFFSSLLRNKVEPMRDTWLKRILAACGIYNVLQPVGISTELTQNNETSFVITRISSPRDVKYFSTLKYEIYDMLLRQKCTNVSDFHVSFVLEFLWRNVLNNIAVAKSENSMPLTLRTLRWLRVSYADMGLDGRIFVDDLYLEMTKYEDLLQIRLERAVKDGKLAVSLSNEIQLGDVDMHHWGKFLCPGEDCVPDGRAFYQRPSSDVKSITENKVGILPT